MPIGRTMKQTIAALFAMCVFTNNLAAQESPTVIEIPAAVAVTEAEMKPYGEIIEHTRVKIEMLPIPSGKYLLGSPDNEKQRRADEGPQREVTLEPFWMGKTEITWNAYDVWMSDIDIQIRKVYGKKANDRDRLADPLTISKPTAPYTDMSFGMGTRSYPAICMTQHAARTFCQWLSAKTGRYYRLPTEAEWEYACRAGTTTAYSFGEDAKKLGEYAWFYDNAGEQYQKVGRKLPNPWGLHDMHGNVSEWVLDQYDEAGYAKLGKQLNNPLSVPSVLFPRTVRGGSWQDEAAQLRSAVRVASTIDWKEQDPQIPQSIWYHTDALHVGFRIVRPLKTPTVAELKDKWDKSEPVQHDKDNPKKFQE